MREPNSAQEMRACAWLRTAGWTEHPQGDACLVLPRARVLWHPALPRRTVCLCGMLVRNLVPDACPCFDVCAGPQSGTLYAKGRALLLVAMLLCCFGSGNNTVFLFTCLRTHFWEVKGVYRHTACRDPHNPG